MQMDTAPVWLGAPSRPCGELEQGPILRHDPLAAPEQQHLPMEDGAEHADLRGKCLLLVLSGSPGRRRVLCRLLQAGCTLVLYAPEPGWASEHVAEHNWILGPVDDSQEALKRVRAWMVQGCCCPALTEASDGSQQPTSRHINGILCIDEYGLTLAAALAHELGLPFTRPDVMEELRSKHLFRQACQRGGVSSPKFTTLTGPLSAEERQRVEGLGMRFPMVVKPAACAGSFNVSRVDTWRELEQATCGFYQALPGYLATLGLPHAHASEGAWRLMVLEEFITGHEVDIDCVVVKGRLLFACVSDNHPCEGSGLPPAAPPDCSAASSCSSDASLASARAFVERGGRCPSNLPVPLQADLLHMASRVVGLWGEHLSGVLHLEAFSTPTGPVPIELNARMGGAETYTNVLGAWGFDLALAAAHVALGLLPHLPALRTLGAEPASQPHCAPPAPDAEPACWDAAAAVHVHLQPDGTGNALPLVLASLELRPSGNSNALLLEPLPAAAAQGVLPLSEQTLQLLDAATPPRPMSLDLPGPAGLPLVAHGSATLLPPREEGGGCPTAASPANQSLGCAALALPDLRPSTGAAFASVLSSTTCSHAPSSSWGEGSLGSGPGSSLGCPGASTDSDGEDRQLLPLGAQRLAASGATSSGGAPGPVGGAGWVESVAGRVQRRLRLTPVPLPRSALSAACPATTQAPAEAADLQGSLQAACAVPTGPGLVVTAQPVTHVHSVNFVPDGWEGEGVVEELAVLPAAQGDPAYVDHELYYRPGALVKLPPAGYGVLGWMVSRGRRPAEAEAAMAAIMKHGVVMRLSKPCIDAQAQTN